MMKTTYHILLALRLPLILLLNAVISAFSFILALGLRFDFDWLQMTSSKMLHLAALNLILLRLASYMYFSLNQGYWRHTSLSDLKDLIRAHALSSALFAASIYAFQTPYPRSCIIMEFILSVFLSGGSRLIVRSISEYLVGKERMRAGASAKETIVLGAGDSGHLLVKLIKNLPHLPYLPVIVLDDLERLKGSNVYGVKVEGPLSLLENCLRVNPGISTVLTAIPSLSDSRTEEIKNICDQYSVIFKKLQSFEDIACLDINDAMQEVSIESVLDKETAVEHEKDMFHAIGSKKVLVTGAGGSIGSELVRQIITFMPKKVILVDNCEFNLYKMANELRDCEIDTEFHVANIRDIRRMSLIFEDEKPELVFHAAAYKHVPLMEFNCYEAFTNNVIGTRNILELSISNKAERFVFISTDKAVDPTSVMGCSKKIAEMVMQYYAASKLYSGGKLSREVNSTKVTAVRFGNVINSNGSVIPLFKEQIANGGPITVTHPEMERFFMSIREAVRLVLTAGTLGESGQIYVLDMGKKLKIVDVAKKMLALYGRRDIEIIFTGLRPAEKMTEELLADYEKIERTNFRKVNKLISALHPDASVIEWINQIEKKLSEMKDSDIGLEMKSFIQQAEDRVTMSELELAVN